MKADQDRVRMLITQTITMLCKKGLEFESELKVQGLLGVTIDSKDIFLIHLNEKYDTVSDTKDIIQRQDSVATSTGNEKSRFSPDEILPDAGLRCGATLPVSSGIVKKEPEPLSPTFSQLENQPTFTDLHDSMTDFFPYSECQTTENASALLGPVGSGDSGFLMDTDHNMTQSKPSVQRAGKADQAAASAGVIMLDSGDEGDDEDKGSQFEFSAPLMDSKSNVSMLVDDKMNMQAAYSKQDLKPFDSSEGQYSSEAESSHTNAPQSQSWALQPFSRSLFPPQSPGRVPFQSHQGQFSPNRFAPFSVGMNRPAAIQSSPGQSVFPTRGTTPRRSPAGQRQPRPMTPGRAGVLGNMNSLPCSCQGYGAPKGCRLHNQTGCKQLSPTMRLRCPTGSGVSPGSSAMFSPPPVMSPAMMRGSPRNRRPRGSTQMQRGASTSAAVSSAMVPFIPSTGAVMRGGAARMSRGASSVRTRTLDGYSYGKQTVTNYICNLCQAVYKNHSSLLTHQVKVHGRQKKEGKGRPKLQLSEMYDDDDDEDEDEDDADMDMMANMM